MLRFASFGLAVIFSSRRLPRVAGVNVKAKLRCIMAWWARHSYYLPSVRGGQEGVSRAEAGVGEGTGLLWPLRMRIPTFFAVAQKQGRFVSLC